MAIARNLRRGQTDAERKLWFRLRDRRLAGLKFHRQMPLDHYVVDFCCESARLIVEVDGGQHTETSDLVRTRELEAMGYLVLRFWNHDVLANTDGVVESVLDSLNKLTPVPPHPNPLPEGEREPH
ncbi:MAG: endonuclease domain-containing protein [Pseudorhodoplanes sp.]